MVQEWFANNIFMYIVLGIFAAGLLVKLMLSLRYRVLIRASKRMGMSKNRLMRVLRLKFETCYKIKLGVNNVDTFVDKYIYGNRFCGIKLYTWESISGVFDILCGLSACVMALLGSFYECGRKEVLYTLSVGILGSALLITMDYLVNLKMKQAVLRTNIKDYLENFLKVRLETGEFNFDVIEQYKKEYLDLPNNTKERRVKRKQTEEVKKANAEPVKGKEKKKDVDEGLKRREAKKRELKQLIASDKQKSKLKELPTDTGKDKEIPFDNDKHGKEEIAASITVQQISPYSRSAVKSQESKNRPKLDLTEEETKVIEDILKEYLS